MRHFERLDVPSRILMGPGPSMVYPRVLRAMSEPTVGHLDPSFVNIMEKIKKLLKATFRTNNELTIPISGTGSLGMETCFVNLVEPGDEVIVCINGLFGQRMFDIVRRCGGAPIALENKWGLPVDLNLLEEKLKIHPRAKIVAFVHVETSTGISSDAEAISMLAHKYNCLTIMDAVSSLGGMDVNVDLWKIDAVYSATQKCLSCPPGLSPISMSDRAVNRIKFRKSQIQSWYLDLNLIMDHWGTSAERVYHHTAPINALYGLYEGLQIIHEQGLKSAWERHRRHYDQFCAGIESLGLSLFVPRGSESPMLAVVNVPPGINEMKIRSQLLHEFNLEIGGGLGLLAGSVWRIGLMGYSSREQTIDYCINSFKSVLSHL